MTSVPGDGRFWKGKRKMVSGYDKIRIEGLEVFANHGVFPEENMLGQKFVISADLYTDTRSAGRTDELESSIHYGEVSTFIDWYLKENTFTSGAGSGKSGGRTSSYHSGPPEDPSQNRKALGSRETPAQNSGCGD